MSFGVVSDASGVSGVRSTDAIVEAERIGLLDDAAVEVWKNLRALSNTARHESGLMVTREQALDYGRLAAQLLTTIQHAVPSAPPAAAPAPRAARPPAPKASRRSPARPAAAKAGGRSAPPAGDDPMYDPVNSPS
jgi:hypothetical protein